MRHYYKSLDGLRFFAMALVFIDHFAHPLGQKISAGYFGVTLFFVLSGFLITRLLMESHEPFADAYKTFLGRRTLRIFPTYYLTLLVLWLAGDPYVRQWFGYAFTYTYNYAWNQWHVPNNSITHIWTLCVEEQFYLLWPFLVLGLRKNPAVRISVVLLLLCSCAIQYLYKPLASPWLTGLGFIPQSYALAIGALGALLPYSRWEPLLRRTSGWWMELIFLLLLAGLLITQYPVRLLLCPLLALILLLRSLHKGWTLWPVQTWLENRHIVYLGRISYGLYLFHLPIGWYLATIYVRPFWQSVDWTSSHYPAFLEHHSWVIELPLYSAVSILLAHLSYQLLEKRILSLKDQWFPYANSDAASELSSISTRGSADGIKTQK